ncbi:MAG: hypothetical protein WBF53_09735 [Litorimonas sp.]
MSVHHNFPAEKLPSELRGSIPDGAKVTIIVDRYDSGLPGYTVDEVNALLDTGETPDEGTVLSTQAEAEAFFDDILKRALDRASANQKP